MTTEWTAERAAALITLWNDGVCASEIGRRLSVTKNAVIGKAFRLQLAKRRPSTAARSDDGHVIRLDGLQAGMCSWPLSTPGEGGVHFCGAAVASGKPYCPAHCKIAYLPATKGRNDAAVA